MICPVCKDQGIKSCVYGGSHGSMTAVHYTPFYDEEGHYHNHDRNILTLEFECSAGHKFMRQSHGGCGAPGCDFKAWEKITIIEDKPKSDT